MLKAVILSWLRGWFENNITLTMYETTTGFVRKVMSMNREKNIYKIIERLQYCPFTLIY